MIRLGRGAWKGHVLRPDFNCRPTCSRLREAVFDILGPEWLEGRRVWDLYAGSGAFGLEALSCGADEAAFVDRSPRSCRLIRDFLGERSALDRAVIVRGDVARSLRRIGFEPDLVFADPPYGDRDAFEWLAAMDWRKVSAPGSRVFVEAGAGTEMAGWKKRDYGGSVLFELKPDGSAVKR